MRQKRSREDGYFRQRRKEILGREAKIEGIEFWAQQFAEHFEFIIDVLKAEELGNPKLFLKLNGMEHRWARIHQDPLLFTHADLEKTLELKHEVKDIVADKPCLPDLLEHMIEEAEYFRDSILDNKYTLKDEISFWANEHAENIDFVGCQLPILIKNDSLGRASRWPSFLGHAFKKDKKLSEKLKELSASNREGFLSGIGRLFGYDRNEVSEEEMDHVFNLFGEHIAGIESLISHVGDLPLSEDNMYVLDAMLNHELNEALFAIQRLRHYHHHHKRHNLF